MEADGVTLSAERGVVDRCAATAVATGVQPQRPHHTKPSLSPSLSLYLSRCLCILVSIPPSLSLGVAQHGVLAPFG